jgi:hypothetical protein
VQYTTTRQNGPCVSHSYTLTFVPNTPAQIYRMQHWIETRATWSGGKNYTINSYDETRLLLRL